MSSNRGSAIVVAAIHLGDRSSGAAFSFKWDFQSDPTKVLVKQWLGDQKVSCKVPTCVLIKPDGNTLDSFGYEAESKYAELVIEDQHQNWYFFVRFSMVLYGKIGVQKDILLEDQTGKKLPAKTVFSLFIRCLKDELITLSTTRIADGRLKPDEIHWVLTVPAFWNDVAKQFMREAAELAGIQSKNLSIALEPEAALLYCLHMRVEKQQGAETLSRAKFKPGTKYLVLDAGDQTVDIRVYEVTVGGNPRQIDQASGEEWGGKQVDEAFRQFLTNVVGAQVMQKLKEEHMADYLDIFKEFDYKKREISPSRDTRMTIRLPWALIHLFEELTGENLKGAIPQTKYAGQITLLGERMRVEADLIKRCFHDPVDRIIDHVGNLLRQPAVSGCAAIAMVGEFSESPMLHQTVEEKFPNIKVIVPEEAGLAVLKGAVIFGHNP